MYETSTESPQIFCLDRTCETQTCMYGEICVVAGIAIVIAALLTTRRHGRRE